MELRSLADAEPFTTKDGSTIRELHHTPAQSLAEASLEPGQATSATTTRGRRRSTSSPAAAALLEVDGESRDVREGDAVLIPPGAWHELVAGPEGARLLCMCVPPYSHDDTFFS